MSGKSDYLATELLDHVLGGGDYTRPATVYCALYTVAPTDAAASGTEVDTGVWTNYARVAIANNATNFPAASGTAPTRKSNGTAIAFGTASVTGSAPVLVGWALYDALTTGNPLYWGLLVDVADAPTTVTVANADTFTIPIGGLDIDED